MKKLETRTIIVVFRGNTSISTAKIITKRKMMENVMSNMFYSGFENRW